MTIVKATVVPDHDTYRYIVTLFNEEDAVVEEKHFITGSSVRRYFFQHPGINEATLQCDWAGWEATKE